MSEQLKEEFKSKESIIEELKKEIKTLKQKKESIDVLWIYPEPGLQFVISPDFIEKLNKENDICEIKVQLTSDRTLKQILEAIDDDYLHKFDVLVIGSCDNAGYLYYKNRKEGLTAELVNEKFTDFQKKGGKILFIHDCMCYNDFFDEIIGEKEHIESTLQTEVQFMQDDHPLMKKPFQLPRESSVAPSHQTFRIYDAMPVINFAPEDYEYYYQENQKRRYAVCEAMHSTYINGFEEKLIYNIIYRIFHWN